jgi:hypothetical protein
MVSFSISFNHEDDQEKEQTPDNARGINAKQMGESIKGNNWG